MQAAFQTPVHDSQHSFRLILQAMSEPGVKVTLPSVEANVSLQPATLAILLTLIDQDTRLWLDEAAQQQSLSEYLSFHCSAVLMDDSQFADFAVITNTSSGVDFGRFYLGSEENPHESTTVIIQTVFQGERSRLVGPGIEHCRELPLGLPRYVLAQRQALSSLMPCGIDLILVDGQDMIALPRTTQIEVC